MKFENSINVKFDELTISLCSIDERINEIHSETKRKTDEFQERVGMLDKKVSDECKTSGNYNGEIITNSNGDSLNANQMMNYKVSGDVKISNDEILLNKNIGNTH